MNVTIYLKPTCPFCKKALMVLKRLNANITEIDIAADPSRRPEMIQKANQRTTVPQIFIDGEHIGGCDDLLARQKAGQL